MSGLSNLNQPWAANCQLSLLMGYKSVANVNYSRSLPLPQRREEKKNHKLSKIDQNVTIESFFKHLISHAQQFNIGPILL